jgi:hypothetical protein
MRVNEPWRDNQSVSINRPGSTILDVAQLDYHATLHCDISSSARRSGAVHNCSILDKQIVRHGY